MSDSFNKPNPKGNRNPQIEVSSSDFEREMEGFVRQIESLHLPQRQETRKRVYVGEKFVCELATASFSQRVFVIDVSLEGLGVIWPKTTRDKSGPDIFQIGQKAQITIKKGKAFHCDVFIRNVSEFAYSGILVYRIGLQFDLKVFKGIDAFTNALPEKAFLCKYFVRPQIYCEDPFFFKEIIFFQTFSFTSKGMDLVTLGRSKQIFPNQKMNFKVFVPGHKLFNVSAINKNFIFKAKNNRYRFYFEYDNPEPQFLLAITDYLIMFGEDCHPAALRKEGFLIQDSGYAAEIEYESFDRKYIEEHKLEPSLISYPGAVPFFEPISGVDDRAVRGLICKLGPYVVATCGLNFVLGDFKKSELKKAWHNFIPTLEMGKHVELIDFYALPSSLMSDFMLTLIKNAVRIAHQSGAQSLLLEIKVSLLELFITLGFHQTTSSLVRKNKMGISEEWLLMKLDIKKVLSPNNAISPTIWAKVYGALAAYISTK